MTDAVLLTDEQVREFIANGFLRLTPDVAPGVHAEIDEMLRYVNENESWYANNILPRIPRMYEVLNCPVVHGAVTSLAGPDYYLHPHRAVHSSTPTEVREALSPEVEAPAMGKGSRAGSGWHQDAQSPLSRARHHVPRYLIGFYFPHDTPVAMGPTRVQAGSHLYANPVAPHAVVLDPIEAGTFLLLHFDMVHAGYPNRTDTTRYMAKFVFTRTRPPEPRRENGRGPVWQRPDGLLPAFDLPNTWSTLYDWLNGAPRPGRAAAQGIDIETRIERFDSTNQPRRLEAIYARTQDADIPRLVDALLMYAGENRHQRTLAHDRGGRTVARDDVRGYPRRWNERAVVMEDAAYALAACGEGAIEALAPLLGHDDPWMQINAAFALGEIGPAAERCVAALGRLLDSPEQAVVRQALDALAAIGVGLAPALPKIERLLTQSNPHWQEAQVTRGWHGEDQVRMNAASVLLAAIHDPSSDSSEIERIAQAGLGDRNGYVSSIVTEVLKRIGSPTANAAALRFLSERCWDDTLRPDRPF